jgi:hypothetical protein
MWVNNKSRVLQHRAYCYRDDEYLKTEDRGRVSSSVDSECGKRPTVIREDPEKTGEMCVGSEWESIMGVCPVSNNLNRAGALSKFGVVM